MKGSVLFTNTDPDSIYSVERARSQERRWREQERQVEMRVMREMLLETRAELKAARDAAGRGREAMKAGADTQASRGCCRRSAWAAARGRRRAEGTWGDGDRGRRVKGGAQAKLRRLLRRSQQREQVMRVGMGLMGQELWVEECMRGWLHGQLHVAQAVMAVQSRQRSMVEAELAVCRDEKERPKRRREELGWRGVSSVVERGMQTTESVVAAAGQGEGRGVEMGTQTAVQPHSAAQPASQQRGMQTDMQQQPSMQQQGRGRWSSNSSRSATPGGPGSRGMNMHAIMDERLEAHRTGGVYPGGTGFSR